MADRCPNQIRARREALGLTQLALAASAKITRQSLGAIEAGRATPAVDVAMRLARALGCEVESLFTPVEAPLVLSASPVPDRCDRVALVQIRGRWVSHPLGDESSRTSADGVVVKRTRREAQVEALRPLEGLSENLLLMGCATGLGVLADRLNARLGAGRYLWLSRSSTASLEALTRDETHVAGVHLVDPRTGEANVPDVRRVAHSESIALITLARWEAGLVLRRGDQRRIRKIDDLAQRGLKLVTRESGSGAQRLLERELRASGLPLALARQAPIRATGHLDLARCVAMGAADTGVAARDAALAFGLHFIPLAEERYDLAVPVSHLADPRLARLCEELNSSAFRRELSALGYEVRGTGDRVAEVRA